jgi:hypothetical protein
MRYSRFPFGLSLILAIAASIAVMAVFHGNPPEAGASPTYVPYWQDEFDGTAADAEKWIAELATSGMRFHTDCGTCNTGYWTTSPTDPPYGSISMDGSILTILNPGLPRVFPFLWSRDSPFPMTGDFSLEIRMKYNYMGGSGTGLVLSANTYDGAGSPPNPLEERVFTIWQDIAHPLGCGLVSEGQLVTGALDTDWHIYRLEYVAGSYSLFVDNALLIGPIASGLRPTSMWLGNPVITWSSWDESTTFSVDYLRVAVPGATPSPTLTPTPRPTAHGVGGNVLLPPGAVAAEAHTAPEGSGWTVEAYAALVAAVSAAFAALGIGGWYARRRRLS